MKALMPLSTTYRLAAALTLICIAPGAHAAEYLNSEQAAGLNLPFSEAVRVGNLLVLSGQLGTLPGTTKLAPGGIAAGRHVRPWTTSAPFSNATDPVWTKWSSAP